MDPKAAAKSKRSHTVHGRRTHQTPAAAAAHKQKRAAAAAPRSRNLPSNWDRFEAEPEADDPASAAEWTGEVPPRSKGADFAFLLEQARTQPREARGLGAATRLASHDSPFDFVQASTSILEAKGEGILSWCEDDNFILEDDLAPDFEVPFLSMDLHALAARLSKLKRSQRLFIEEDLLPVDLAVASEDNQILIQRDRSLESEAKDSLVQHNFADIKPGKDAIDHHHASNIQSDDKMKTDHQLECFEEEKTTASPKIGTQLVHSDTEDDKSYTGITDTVPHSDGSKLEVVAAEEQLDMLLNSLSGTRLSNSNLDQLFVNNSSLGGMKINESNKKVPSPSTSSKSLALAPLDDALDVLLSETSLSVQNEGFAASSLTSQPTFNSDNGIDLRYAKQIDVTSVDDSVDNLLADTSLGLNDQKQTTSVQGQQNISNDSVPPHSGPSNVSADFDSWFDSLRNERNSCHGEEVSVGFRIY